MNQYVIARVQDGVRQYFDMDNGQAYYRWFASCSMLFSLEDADDLCQSLNSTGTAWHNGAVFSVMDVHDAIEKDNKE